MRVIAGLAKGQRLRMPRVEGVRATHEPVREALFGILGEWVKGRFVLDLFAGSGALGIEALSRGATGAVFVDVQTGCAKAINENLERCGLAARALVIRGRIPEILARVRRANPAGFDLVLLDPPYGSGQEREALQGLLRFALLKESARIVCEHGKRWSLAGVPDGCRLDQERRYGDSTLTFLTFKPGAKTGNGQCEKS